MSDSANGPISAQARDLIAIAKQDGVAVKVKASRLGADYLVFYINEADAGVSANSEHHMVTHAKNTPQAIQTSVFTVCVRRNDPTTTKEA